MCIPLHLTTEKSLPNMNLSRKTWILPYYFARPYHSWEIGSNENYNRLLRQYFPKGTSFEHITDEQLKAVQDKLNNRDRKRLGFVSPIKYLHSPLLTKVAFTT